MDLTPIDTDPDPFEDKDKLYTITSLAGKGYGVIATQDITPGTIIFREDTYMKIPVPAISLTENHITEAFTACSEDAKTSILALHEGDAPDASSLMRIFKANTFGDAGNCWLHPTICRINHSCVPNAQIVSDECCLGDVASVMAEKSIRAGEEICFSYNHELYEITTAKQRAVLLRKQYGFACDCEACESDERLREISDARRMMIKELRRILHGVETSKMSLFEDIDPLDEDAMEGMTESTFWMRESKLYKGKLPTWKKTALTLLLAQLREAEGSAASTIAGDYWNAAQYMLEQVQNMGDIVVLPWARNVQTWMEKAIEVMERVYSPYDHDPQRLRSEWKIMQAKPCMQVGKAYFDGKLKVSADTKKASEDEEHFAIQITQDKSLVLLSRARCDALLQERLGSTSPVSQDDEPATVKEMLASKIPDNLRSKLPDSNGLYKVCGAAVTCAAPVAAYWWYK